MSQWQKPSAAPSGMQHYEDIAPACELWHYCEYSTLLQIHVRISTYLHAAGRASLAQVGITSVQACGLCDLPTLS